MNETHAAALITQARNLAAGHRYADAVRVLDVAEFREFAATSQHPDLVVVLAEWAWWMAWSGRIGDALAIWNELEQRPTPDLSAQLRFAMRARHAYVVGISGAEDTSKRAVEMLSAIVADLEDEDDVGVDLRFHLRRSHARWLGTAGEPERAMQLLSAIEAEFGADIAHESEEWLLLMSNLAYFSATSGPVNEEGTREALGRYQALVRARTEALGAQHPHTLDARRNCAWVLGRREPEPALMQLATMVHDSEGVLDADHRYVMAARVDMAVLASRLEASEIVIEQVDLITAAVSRAQTAVDVLSEYGFVEAPAAKLDEVAQYLAARGDLSRSANVRALRARLIGS